MPRSPSSDRYDKRRYSHERRHSYDRRYSRSRSGDRRRDPFLTENQVYVARFNKRYTTERDLRKAFEQFGKIEKIDLKEGRGFGFIYFERRKDALEAIDEMHNKKLESGDERIVVERAGLDRRGRGPRHRRRDSRRRSGSGHPLNRIPRGGSDICYNCNKEGHYARDCKASPKPRRGGRDRDRDRNEGRCFHCAEKGHIKADCPKLAARSRSQSRSRSPRRSMSRERSFSRRRSDSRGRRSDSRGRRSDSRDRKSNSSLRKAKRYSGRRSSERRQRSDSRKRSNSPRRKERSNSKKSNKRSDERMRSSSKDFAEKAQADEKPTKQIEDRPIDGEETDAGTQLQGNKAVAN